MYGSYDVHGMRIIKLNVVVSDRQFKNVHSGKTFPAIRSSHDASLRWLSLALFPTLRISYQNI